MSLVRSAQCPNCGAPIQFALGSSVSLVCGFCSHVVVRTDRDLRSIGKIAELVPTVPPFEVGDEIRVETRSARVSGRVQKDFGAGPWDELSIEFDNGEWAWLARAQGRWYVSSRVDDPGAALPPAQAVQAPGAHVRLGANPAEWTVMEARQSRVLAARGEFPEPFAPNEVSLYADLIASGDAFATLDYASLSSPATLYLGRVLPAESIVLVRAALGERPRQKVSVAKLRCPNCGAPIELVDATHTERVACGACAAISQPDSGDKNLALTHLSTGAPLGAALAIPLGKKGKLRGVEVTVIGAMRRYTVVDDTRYDWLEYLLYSEQGYLWLLEDNGHFTFIRDADPSKIRRSPMGAASYDGRDFKAFFRNHVYVSAVAGEFYWKVAVGDETFVEDFIAPPHVLSCERTGQEVTFSLGEYLEPSELIAAFGPLRLPPRHGVAPAQPGPRWQGAAYGSLVGALMICVFSAFIGKCSRDVASWPIAVRAEAANANPFALGDNPGLPPTGAPDDVSNISVSPRFTLAEMTTLGLELSVPQENLSVATECALVNETTGDTREFTIDAGYYAGVSGGESWSEGSHTETAHLDRVAPGTYSVHVRSQWEAFTGDGAYPAIGPNGGPAPPTPTMRVVENERSPLCPIAALLVLVLPLLLAAYRAWAFQKKRWENSNLIVHGDD